MFFCNHFQILFFQKIFVFKLVMRDSTTSKLRLLEIAAKILIDKNVADISTIEGLAVIQKMTTWKWNDAVVL